MEVKMTKQSIEHVDAHIARKYKIGESIGKGAYGIVWRGTNRKTNEQVAVKKIFDAFQNDQDAQRTYREVMILLALRHPNIIKLKTFFKSKNDVDLYLSFEFMETDLHKVIKANILEDIHKKYIFYQLLSTIEYLHNLDIVHRDIKPSNLLLNSDCHVKLCDFGLSRTMGDIDKKLDDSFFRLTEYVATRWYRAPELLLGSRKYTKSVDIWACGCVLGEIIKGKPLFPGTSTLDQLKKLVGFSGKLSKSDISSVSSSSYSLMNQINNGSIEKKSIKCLFPNTSEDALDLMKKLLKFNPNERITAREALNHPYTSIFSKKQPRKKLSLKEKKKIVNNLNFVLNDSKQYKKEEYREKLYQIKFKNKRKKRKKRVRNRKKKSSSDQIK